MASLFICGDIINLSTERQFISSNLISIIKDADYSICNFEGVLVPTSVNRGHKVLQHPSTLHSLKQAGFDLLLLANNHICDFGIEGLRYTIEQIDSYSFDYIGAGLSFEDAYRPIIKEINGIKFGILNFCEFHPGGFVAEEQNYGYAWTGHSSIHNTIVELREVVDYILVFVHAGLEHYELPLKEWREFYRGLCEMGVNCVIGAHPHVPQGIEKYKDSVIFYSLGNFFFHKKDGNSENESFSLLLNIEANKEISYDVIFHRFEDEEVHLINKNESIINLEQYNSVLSLNSLYMEDLNKIYVDAYMKMCYPQLSYIFMGTEYSDNLTLTLRKILKYLFFRKRNYKATSSYRRKIFNHLINNETYLYVIRNGLKLIENNEK